MTVFTKWRASLLWCAFTTTACITFSKWTPSWTFCSPANFQKTSTSQPLTSFISLNDYLKENPKKLLQKQKILNFKKNLLHIVDTSLQLLRSINPQ